MRLLKSLCPLALVLCVGAFGCKKESPAGGTASTSAAAPAKTDSSTTVAKVEPAKTEPAKGPAMTPPAAAPAKSAGPAESMNAVRDAIVDGKLEVVWDQLMPGSYQKDVEGIIVDFAGKVDPELFNTTTGVAKKLVKVLADKKDFILAHPLAANVPNKDEITKNWDGGIKALSTFVNSDLMDLNKLKKPDVRGFIATTGNDLFKQASAASSMTPGNNLSAELEKMKSAKATVVKQDGGTAILKMEIEGKDPKEEEFVLVEGKWIPKEMADGWKDGITKAKEGIAGMTQEQMDQAKAQALPMLKQVDGVLDQALAAKTADEFNAAVGQLMGMAMMMGAGAGGPPGGGPPPGAGAPPAGLPELPSVPK